MRGVLARRFLRLATRFRSREDRVGLSACNYLCVATGHWAMGRALHAIGLGPRALRPEEIEAGTDEVRSAMSLERVHAALEHLKRCIVSEGQDVMDIETQELLQFLETLGNDTTGEFVCILWQELLDS